MLKQIRQFWSRETALPLRIGMVVCILTVLAYLVAGVLMISGVPAP